MLFSFEWMKDFVLRKTRERHHFIWHHYQQGIGLCSALTGDNTLISLETGLSLQRKNNFYSVVGSDAFRGNIDLLWCSLEFYVSIDVLELLNLSQDFSWKDWNIRPRPSLIAFQQNVVNQSDSENSSKRMCISVLGPPQVFHFTLPANWWENP